MKRFIWVLAAAAVLISSCMKEEIDAGKVEVIIRAEGMSSKSSLDVKGHATATHLMDWGSGNIKDVLSNNADYYVRELISITNPVTTLLLIGLILTFMTFLKTAAYFLSSAAIIPMRTGVVRDIRNSLYKKITSLSLGFFSEERKGDIIARMSGDVQEIENSIMAWTGWG